MKGSGLPHFTSTSLW